MTDATLPALIQQMLEPGFYPHPVQEPIRLMQTHCSYVLLTGDRVYKLKKPVNFGFLDYSTLEKRQHFIQEELRLNQRGAAPLYKRALPIVLEGDRYRLADGPADWTLEPVEWCLEMVQFPDQALLSAEFEAGAVTPELLTRLARAIADFHRLAAVNDHIRSYGSVERIREAFDQNYEQTAGYIGGPQTQERYEATKRYSDAFFARTELFAARVAADKVRECHGDLHLGNICHWNDTLYLFDCIEFNEPFRFVDTMYDLAFLAMDLDARGRSDLATVVRNAYCEETGDWEGLAVLPLYLSRQAYVRAKVTSFLLDDPAIPADVKQQSFERAQHYYELAHRYTERRPGRLFLTNGHSGSGKSTVARTLAARTGAVHLRSDAVRKHLAGVPLREQAPQSAYSREMTEATYARLQDLGLKLVAEGYDVILDATYDRQAPRAAVTAAAAAAGIPLTILRCQAPEAVLRQRVSDRQGDIADATVAVLEAQMAGAEPLTAEEAAITVTIDTTGDLEAQLAVL
jgi:aminoglycoside phosphotransferase family enzyme/predicted kinase